MEIKFLQAGCGDAIHIRFEGSDNHYHNILIDGGAEQHDICQNGIESALVSIRERNEIIDLWIITHIDDDHIGDILRFVKDEAFRKTFDLSKTIFWYNAWHSLFEPSSSATFGGGSVHSRSQAFVSALAMGATHFNKFIVGFAFSTALEYMYLRNMNVFVQHLFDMLQYHCTSSYE